MASRAGVRDCETRRDKVWLPAGLLGQQPQAPEAGVALAADYQVVVDGDAERFGGLADFLRHLDVVARRLGIARRMVVDQHCSQRIALTRNEFCCGSESLGYGIGI